MKNNKSSFANTFFDASCCNRSSTNNNTMPFTPPPSKHKIFLPQFSLIALSISILQLVSRSNVLEHTCVY